MAYGKGGIADAEEIIEWRSSVAIGMRT